MCITFEERGEELRRLSFRFFFAYFLFIYLFFFSKKEVDMLLGMLAPLAVIDFSLYLKDIDFDHLPTDLRFYDSDFTVAAVAGLPTEPTTASAVPSPDRRLRRTFSFSQAFSSLSYASPTFAGSPARPRKSSALSKSSTVPPQDLSSSTDTASIRVSDPSKDEELLEKCRLFSDRPTLEQLR